MAYNYTLQQGEDRFVEIAVVDENGTDVDLTTDVVNIFLTITTENNNTQFLSYSLNTKTSFLDMAIKTATTNVLEFSLVRDNTKDLSVGAFNVNVLVDKTDAVLTNKRDEYNFSDFMLIQNGLTKDIQI